MAGKVKMASLPPPRPKSPPEYPDLYGKRRELARVQLLEREIGFLEIKKGKEENCMALELLTVIKNTNDDELKFVESLQPASQPCKEITDFVVANSDPFIPTTKKVHKSCGFWKWLCGASCFSFSFSFSRNCCRGCTLNPEVPNCCYCNMPRCSSCIGCSKPKCRCCSCQDSQCCCKMPSCSLNCCVPKCPSCYSNCGDCKGCISCYPKCPKLNLCSCCTKKSCCYTCYMCC